MVWFMFTWYLEEDLNTEYHVFGLTTVFIGGYVITQKHFGIVLLDLYVTVSGRGYLMLISIITLVCLRQGQRPHILK